MNVNLKGNRTTWIGVLTILGAVINAGIELTQHKPVDLKVLFGAISTGLVAIQAADSKQ